MSSLDNTSVTLQFLKDIKETVSGDAALRFIDVGLKKTVSSRQQEASGALRASCWALNARCKLTKR